MALLASPFGQGGLKVKKSEADAVGDVNRMERPLLKQPVARRKIYAGGVSPNDIVRLGDELHGGCANR